jgi:chromate reductase, NAD(P)H dehydrogenase (quinone)
MAATPLRVLLLAGSARQGAFSVRLRDAAARLAEAAGASTSVLDLRALGLPLYDGDIEASQGVPAGAHQLRTALASHDAMLMVTPEYNGFPTPLVLNAFDWLSRLPAGDGLPSGLAVTANKPTALLSISPGAIGGLRAMNFLRQYLQMAFGMLVVPRQHAVGHANDVLDAHGAFKDEKAEQAVAAVVQGLLRVGDALRAPG